MIIQADARFLPLKDNSVDAVVTDPPYNLTSGDKRSARRATPLESSREKARGFMGMKWDGTGVVFDPEMWAEVLRVMKPGAHMLAFGGSRTFHRVACAIEDAGFELRDCCMWIYGSGFPKSRDVSKAIDKAAGAERTDGIREWRGGQRRSGIKGENLGTRTLAKFDTPATDAARAWSGWGTALKPAYEPIILARKPLSEKNVVANVLKWGTGAINIDACRIGTEQRSYRGSGAQKSKLLNHGAGDTGIGLMDGRGKDTEFSATGRWPANVILDQESAQLLDEQSGELTSGANPTRRGTDKFRGIYSAFEGQAECVAHRGQDSGGASRFFYTSKASSAERGEGNNHPTVKPVDLMEWLCKLVTPPNGLILDCFYGSGSTGIAAVNSGFRIVGIDLEYHGISRQRLYGPLFAKVINSV